MTIYPSLIFTPSYTQHDNILTAPKHTLKTWASCQVNMNVVQLSRNLVIRVIWLSYVVICCDVFMEGWSLTAFLMARKSSTAESSLLSSSPLRARAIKPDGSRSCDLSGDFTGAPWDKSATTWPRLALPNSRTAASCTETHHFEDLWKFRHRQLSLWTQISYVPVERSASGSD